MADHGSVLPVAKGNWESTVSLLQKASNVSAWPTTQATTSPINLKIIGVFTVWFERLLNDRSGDQFLFLN